MAIKFLSSGNVTGGLTLSGALSGTSASFTGDLAINTNKFTVNATSGNSSIAGNLSVSGIGSSFNTGNSGTFVTNDGSGYPRITTTDATAQLGLFRSGGSAGGMYIGADSGGLEVMTSAFATKFSLDNSGNGIFAGTITSGALTVGNSGTSRFTDTSAFPLQLNRGLDVDSVGANGAVLGIGTIKSGTYKDGVRISGGLETNGTDGIFTLQTLGGGSYTTALTIDSSQNSTFAGTVQVDGSNATVIHASDPNVTVSDTDTNYRGSMRWLTSSNVLEFFTRYAGTYYTNNLVLDRGKVGIGTTTPDTTLNIDASGGANIRLERSSATTNRFDIGTDGSDMQFVVRDTGDFTFTGGNVGIGTTSPERKLDVKSNSDTAPSAYLRGGKSSQGEIQNTGLIVGTQTEIAAGDYQGISFTGYTAAGAIHRSRAAVGVLAVNGPGKMDLVFMAKHQDDGTGLLSDDIKMVIKGSLTSNKQSRVGIGYDFVASKIHEPEGSNALDVYGTGFFGYQDFRDHDTYPPQKVLVLRGAPASGAYAQSRFNWYTKSGTTSNGIAAIQIKSQYGTDAESGVLFHFGGSGNLGIGTDSPSYGKLQIDQTSGNNLALRKGTGYAAVAFGGVTNNEATFLIEGNASQGFRVYNGTGTLASPTWTAGMDFYDQGRLHPYGGVFLGSSNNSNLLDDYEEGTWTPVIKDLFGNQASTSAALGTYRKIGSQLIVNYDVRLSSKGSMTGNYVLLALPFTHAGSTCGTGTIDKFNNMTTAFSSMAWDTTSTNTVAWLVGVEGTSATSSVYVTPAEISSTTKFKGTIIYHQ